MKDWNEACGGGVDPCEAAQKAWNQVKGIIDDIHAFLARFVAYPSEHAHVAHTLWIAHAHLIEAFESTPRLAFLSPEPASGKTRAIEITELLVPRPVCAVNVSPAYLFRKVADEAGRPTILYDEIDTVFGPKARDNEEIRGLLNAGHRKGAVAGRCVVKGKLIETEEIPAYSAVALAGLGDLPDTILSRSIVVQMRRRAPGESVEPYRRRLHEPQGTKLRDCLAAWCAGRNATISKTIPEMPPEITDRDADVWEPLLAIADAAGGEWPKLARCSAVALVALTKWRQPSLGVRLLADMRIVFGDAEAKPTVEVLKALTELPESPWIDIKGKTLTDRRLAGLLRRYGIASKNVRVGEAIPKGYARADFLDAWGRYLGSPHIGTATAATALHADDEEPPW